MKARLIYLQGTSCLLNLSHIIVSVTHFAKKGRKAVYGTAFYTNSYIIKLSISVYEWVYLAIDI